MGIGQTERSNIQAGTSSPRSVPIQVAAKNNAV
jgi:hypothetical protein